MTLQINWRDFLERKEDQAFVLFFGEPVVLHCHHFNLFLEQTIEDPPYVPGRKILLQNAYESSHCLLQKVAAQLTGLTPEKKLDQFLDLLGFLGHGRLQPEGAFHPDGGTLRGVTHSSIAWKEKYGQSLQRKRGVDYFVRGFLTAAIEIAYEMEPGSIRVEEVQSPVLGDEVSVFASHTVRGELHLRPCTTASLPLPESETYKDEPPPFDLDRFTRELSAIADAMEGDDRGLIHTHQVYVTRHLARYYAGIQADFYSFFLNHQRDLLSPVQELLLESAHVCVFHTFGNLLMDPEIQALADGLSSPEAYVFAATGVARALGFGQWSVGTLTPGELLTLRAPSEYEGLFFQVLPEGSSLPLFFMPGAAAAIMNLVYVARVHENASLTYASYTEMMLGNHGEIFKGETVRARHRGDPWTESVSVRAGVPASRVDEG